jgi:hypothetical protein
LKSIFESAFDYYRELFCLVAIKIVALAPNVPMERKMSLSHILPTSRPEGTKKLKSSCKDVWLVDIIAYSTNQPSRRDEEIKIVL